jgi:diguanylate cyclase (GGDEF)-like protein
VAACSYDGDQERGLAGRLAGVLFLTAGITALLLLLVPGVETGHRDWVIGLTAGALAWGLFCVTVARPREHGPWFWHTPAVGSLLFIAGVMAATGGADSPARFYLFFVLFYTAYFYRRHDAAPYVLGCVAAALLPFLYDGEAVSDGYVGEVVVVCPTYVILGTLVMRGKELLVSLREEAEALALLDPLTELANRRAMIDWLGAEIGRESPTGLILVDLDGFKDVNTAHGYPAGDSMLREAAARLGQAAGPDDLVARLGGDEFAVLAANATSESMRVLTERVLASMRHLEYEGVRVTASVGWVTYPDDAPSVDELIAAADFCLRGAKMTGKDRALSALDWAPDADEELAA